MSAEPAEPVGGGEAERIRQVYAERDQRPARHPAIVEAYRRINAERLARMEAVLRVAAPPPQGRILDVGCGGGGDIRRWIEAGWAPAAVAGTDLVPARVAAARAVNPDSDIRLGDGASLPFPDAAFEVATAVTVFSSILDPAFRRRLFQEMGRVVRPGGLILVYDFVVAKPTNRTTTGMTLDRLRAMATRVPEHSERLSPLLQLVAAGAFLGPRAADVAARWAPRTHRLSSWSV